MSSKVTMPNKSLSERVAEYARKESERLAQPTMTFKINKNLEIAKAALPDGYVIVSINELIQIEDAIAFELGGEPCGLYEAHKLVKAMIQAAREEE